MFENILAKLKISVLINLIVKGGLL